MQSQLMRQLMMKSNLVLLLASRAFVFSIAALLRSFYFVTLQIIINFDSYEYINMRCILYTLVKITSRIRL